MALSLLAANNAQTVLAAGISSTATSLTVSTGTGTLFPSPVAGTSFFKLTIIDAATGSLTEIVHVTARAGDVFTIQRAQEGTTARAWSANDIAANMMTAGTLSYILGNFQPLDPTLTALAALVGVANKLPYFNGNDTAALTDLTQVGRDIIGQTDIAAVLQYLGSSDGTLNGRLLNVHLFTAGGQYTPTVGMKFILAHMIGGGGASGGTPATSSSQTGGVAAGNSGAYAYIKAYASDIGAGKAVSVGAGGKSQVNGAGFAGGTTAIADIADVTGGYGSDPGSVGATTAVAQPSYNKPVINKYNKTEVLAFSLGSQAWNFLQAAIGSGTGWLSPASPFPGGERGRGGSGIFVNASSAAQAGLAGNDGAILIMEYA